MTRETGIITLWEDDKGFGFITPTSGCNPIFFHAKEFSKNHNRPEVGLAVNYFPSADEQGRNCAINVEPEKGHKRRNKKDTQILLSIFFASTFLSMVGMTVLVGKLSPFIFGLYLIASLITYVFYSKDKSAAQAGTWRISERTLHVLSLAGGWPGALIAQNKLRHKSKKGSFRTVYWITVIINCFIFVGLLTPEGNEGLNSIIKNIISILPTF